MNIITNGGPNIPNLKTNYMNYSQYCKKKKKKTLLPSRNLTYSYTMIYSKIFLRL